MDLLWSILGVTAFAIVSYLIIQAVNRRIAYRRNAALFRDGVRVTARVAGLVPGKRAGWSSALVCKYFDPATGREYSFVSDLVDWKCRVPEVGSSVSVYADPDSGFADYLVDLSSLPGRKGPAF